MYRCYVVYLFNETIAYINTLTGFSPNGIVFPNNKFNNIDVDVRALI